MSSFDLNMIGDQKMRLVQDCVQEDKHSEKTENEKERRKRALEMKKRLFGSFYCDAGQGLYACFRDGSSPKLKRVPERLLIDHFQEYSGGNDQVMELAKEVQAHVAPNSPSFIKTMVYTNVSHGFCLNLPKQFSQLYMPRHDTTVTLVVVSGGEYKTNFLVQRSALSGGWGAFSRENDLLVGDVLVFRMVKPLKFKVYIVRAQCLSEVDGALGLMSLNACSKKMGFKEDSTPFELAERSEVLGDDATRTWKGIAERHQVKFQEEAKAPW